MLMLAQRLAALRLSCNLFCRHRLSRDLQANSPLIINLTNRNHNAVINVEAVIRQIDWCAVRTLKLASMQHPFEATWQGHKDANGNDARDAPFNDLPSM
ncbi:MAG: hypothetical protein VKL00_05955 [Synechococcales bacterium]|nr:hypothetical protein [Synechococcales bacterium]